jgi:hypothetical protein
MSGQEVGGAREIKVYDDSRQPRDWHLLLAPWQCAVLLTLANSHTPVSSDGIPFRRFSDTTFFLFDSLAAARADDGSLSAARKRQWIAIALLLASFPLIWWDSRTGGWMVLPTYIGISMIVAAFRLFFWNLGSKELAARDQARLQSHLERERQYGANARTLEQPWQAS